MIQGITATVYVSDMDRAVDFYTQTLGLPLSERWGNEYASIDLGKGRQSACIPRIARTAPRLGATALFKSASPWTGRSMRSSGNFSRGE